MVRIHRAQPIFSRLLVSTQHARLQNGAVGVQVSRGLPILIVSLLIVRLPAAQCWVMIEEPRKRISMMAVGSKKPVCSSPILWKAVEMVAERVC